MAPSSISILDQPHPNDVPVPSSDGHHAAQLTWTPAHEARFAHVQAQLSAAQASWSEEQELWIDEVHELEELRHAYKKALKKEAKRRAKRANGMWRTRTSSSSTTVEDGDSGEEADDCEDDRRAEWRSQETRCSSLSVKIRRISSTRSRQSSFCEGEPSSALRRLSIERRSIHTTFTSLLRRFGTRRGGRKGSESPFESSMGRESSRS